MTRLCSDDIADIAASLKAYDNELRAKTGCNLSTIAGHAVGINPDKAEAMTERILFAVVPIRGAQGVIDGFSETVAHILTHIGLRAFVTRDMDAAGLAEAFEKAADVVFLADDRRFVALNLITRQVVDNADATGKGFVAGLGLMSGGLSGQKVLVLGCGPVGCAAVKALANLGADAAIYDIDQSRCHDLSVEISRPPVRQIKIENNLLRSLAGHRLLIDATNASGIIDEAWIKPECYIAAPGMPLGLSPAGLKKIGSRILHDPLQTGVATMALEAIKQLSDET